MKLSKAIKKLQALQEKVGDVEIEVISCGIREPNYILDSSCFEVRNPKTNPSILIVPRRKH